VGVSKDCSLVSLETSEEWDFQVDLLKIHLALACIGRSLPVKNMLTSD